MVHCLGEMCFMQRVHISGTDAARLVESFQPDFVAVEDELCHPPSTWRNLMITSACYSPHLDSAIGPGFVAAGHLREAVIDPNSEFRSIELLVTPVYDPHKRIPRLPWKPDAR